MNARPVRAAGGVVWRTRERGNGTPEVALVHRARYDDWSLPKGKLERGEHVVVAARREATEETGFDVVLGRPLPTQHYVTDGGPKEVRYWAARASGGASAPYGDVDAVEWLSPAVASERLTWERDATVLEAFAAGPLATVPLVLMRHASAVDRAVWEGPDDASRPLDDQGRLESSRLPPLLRSFGVTRVLASDTRRTIDTVRPFTESDGLPVELSPVLSQEGFAERPDAALERARSLLRTQRGTVVCTHRPVIPWLLATLFESSGHPPPQVLLRPAEFWVLHVADGRIAACERHGPFD